jgi:hypothetical protein
MSELSMAEMESQSVELLPRRETLSIIIVDATAIATARDAQYANAINKNIIGIIDSGNNVVGLHNHVDNYTRFDFLPPVPPT